MDLEISGRKAIICNVESHLALACADALGSEGVSVLLGGSHRAMSDIAIRGMREGGSRQITVVQENATTEETLNSLLRECAEPDIVILGDARRLRLLDLVCNVVPGMRSRGFGRILTIDSTGIGGQIDEEVTGPMHDTVSQRELARDNVTINSIIAGRFSNGRREASGEAAKRLAISIPAGRLGKPQEIGATCAFLCGQAAGSVTGMSLLVDGGDSLRTFA